MYTLNLPNILKQSRNPLATSMARQLQLNGYITIGQALKSISDMDLAWAVHQVYLLQSDEATLDEQTEAGAELTLITMLGILGEGLMSEFPEPTEENDDTAWLGEKITATASFIIAEHTIRQFPTQVEAVYENWTYDDSMDQVVMIKRID